MNNLTQRLSSPAIVYTWSDHLTGKVYCGSHKGTENDGYMFSSKYLKLEYKKRPNDFTRQILAKGDWKDCRVLEHKINQQLIKNLNTTYNKHAFPAIVNDIETIKETGRKVSIALKGRSAPPERGKNISKAKKGKPLTKAHREALSKAHKGRKDSSETIAIRSLALKGINKGPKSLSHRNKIKETIKNLWKDPEYRAMQIKVRAEAREKKIKGIL